MESEFICTACGEFVESCHSQLRKSEERHNFKIVRKRGTPQHQVASINSLTVYNSTRAASPASSSLLKRKRTSSFTPSQSPLTLFSSPSSEFSTSPSPLSTFSSPSPSTSLTRPSFTPSQSPLTFSSSPSSQFSPSTFSTSPSTSKFSASFSQLVYSPSQTS